MLRIRKGKKDEIDDEKFSTSFEKESDEGKFDSSSEADESFSIDAPGKARSPSPIITQQPLPLYPRPSTSKQYGADPLYPRPALPSTSKQYGADRTQKVIVPLPTESGNKILKPPQNKGASTSNQPDLGDYCLINSDKQQLRRIFDAFICCLPLPHVQVAFFAVLIAILPGFLSGLLLGIYAMIIIFLVALNYISQSCISPTKASGITDTLTTLKDEIDEIATAEEHQNIVPNDIDTDKDKTYKGWMNLLTDSEQYDPLSFDIDATQTVLVRLHGKYLRISFPDIMMLKHAFHTDPTLTEREPRMHSQQIFDLTNAVVKLRPRRLARRRWFSRKYPIFIALPKKSNATGIESSTSEVPLRPSIPAIAPPSIVPRANPKKISSRVDAIFVAGPLKEPSEDWLSLSTESEVFETNLPAPNIPGTSSSSSHQFLQHSVSDFQIRQSGPNAAIASGSGGGTFPRSTSTQFPDNQTTPRKSQESDWDRSGKEQRKIYLFARSAREKERWFHRLRKTCYKYRISKTNIDQNSADGIQTDAIVSDALTIVAQSSSKTRRSRYGSFPGAQTPLIAGADANVSVSNENAQQMAKEYMLYILSKLLYNKQMEPILLNTRLEKIGNTDAMENIEESKLVAMDLGRINWEQSEAAIDGEFVLLLNLVASRVFYDFCRDNYWCGLVRDRFQTKLSTIALPYFVEPLKLSELDLGTVPPQITKIYPPTMDDWGIWIDFEIKYKGMIKLTLETKMNVMKVVENYGSSSSADDSPSDLPPTSDFLAALFARKSPSAYSDSDVPESPEQSPDEEFGARVRPIEQQTSSIRSRAKQGMKDFLGRAAIGTASALVNQVEGIRKKAEAISETRLVLNVEVSELYGLMSCNFPPPPSERLWYCFRRPPQISIKATPQIGDRSMVIALLGNWIEEKISRTIEDKISMLVQKALVFPNLDDVIIPMMVGNELLKKGVFNV